MSNELTKEDLLAIAEFSCLENGGVDNWVWYGDSLEDNDYTHYEDTAEYSKEMLRCLEAGGVDNWEWYGESLTGIDEYETYLDGLEEEGRLAEAESFYFWYEKFKAEEEKIAQAEKEEAEKAAKEEAEKLAKVEATTLKDESEEKIFAYLTKDFPDFSEEYLKSATISLRGSAFWKNGTFKKEWKQAFAGSVNFIEAKTKYATLLIENGKLKKFINF